MDRPRLLPWPQATFLPTHFLLSSLSGKVCNLCAANLLIYFEVTNVFPTSCEIIPRFSQRKKNGAGGCAFCCPLYKYILANSPKGWKKRRKVMIFLWSPFDVKCLDCKMWCFPCACACVLRARITPVIVFFCCHICHTRGRKGWKKAKMGELKIVKTHVFGVHNEQNNDCDRDCLSNLTKRQMQQLEIQ